MAVETEFRLQDSRSVTLDANGEATVTNIGPTRPNERWKVTRFSVNTTVACDFQVFRGNDTNADYQIDFTSKGAGDTSETDLPLSVGETISFKWSAGTPGAIGTIRWEGSYFIPGKRAY
jgi:hypothetical protein